MFSNSLISDLARLPPSIIILSSPGPDIIRKMGSVARHVVLVQGMECDKVLPSRWDTNLYCDGEDELVEHYEVGGHRIRTVLNTSLARAVSTRATRRSDLMGVEIAATAIQDEE